MSTDRLNNHTMCSAFKPFKEGCGTYIDKTNFIGTGSTSLFFWELEGENFLVLGGMLRKGGNGFALGRIHEDAIMMEM